MLAYFEKIGSTGRTGRDARLNATAKGKAA